jgi:hypothetical protein
VYGGEYKAFSACVEGVVKAWIAVGLRVYFVFDGMSRYLFIVAHPSSSKRSAAKVLHQS